MMAQVWRQSWQKAKPDGFALPTVLIISIILLAIGASTLQLASAISRSLTDQHWNREAKIAAQAGVSFASSCLSAGVTTWSSTLTPNKKCDGSTRSPDPGIHIGADTSANASPSRWRSTYTVAPPVVGSDTIPRSEVTGIVETITSGNSVAKTYTYRYNTILSVSASAPLNTSAVGIGASSAGADTASCMIAADQQVYCAGENDRGNLGDGTLNDRTRPVLFGGPSSDAAGKNFTQVAVGYRYACAVTTDQLIYCAGENTTGQLGYSNTSNQLRPVQFGATIGKKFIQVATGLNHTCAVTTDQLIYCAGTNMNGRFGTGSTSPLSSSTPLQFGASTGKKFLQVSTGTGHTCAITTDLLVYCAGQGNNYQLGNGSNLSTNATAVKFAQSGVAATKTFTQVAAGQYSTCAISTEQLMYCVGNNGFYVLGNGSSTSPVTVPASSFTTGSASGKRFTQVGTNGSTTCALSTEKYVMCAGSNTFNQLGYSGFGNYMHPVMFGNTQSPTVGKTYTQVSVGSFYTCAVGTDQLIYCSGDNDGGQQGVGHTNQRTKPDISMVIL